YTDAKHFGEIVWARYASNSLPGHEFYNNESEKSDFNSFLKVTYDIIPGLNVYADFQVRNINYTADGLDREWTDGDRIIDIDKAYTFLNPKGGLMYQIDDAMSVYTSYALAHREPNRSDFLDAPGNIEPKPEQLQNLEIGYKANFDQTAVEIVGYNMQYYNQLVMTGKLNDVGTPIRKNVGESYRRGIEIIASHKPLSFLEAGASVTLSTNKTSYKEFLSGDSTFVDHKDMTLSYSPSVIGSAQVIFTPFENLQAGFYLKHVGSQYVDNTESEELQLPAYTLLDFKMNYSIAWNKAGIIDLFFNVYNLTDEQYSSYGAVHWTGSLGYFPQAGINYLCGASLKF
ncbi:MAG: TonB-dependent receptor domain-containing protein, partial [Bacteroidota bacterium]